MEPAVTLTIDQDRLARVQAAGLGKGKHPPPPEDGEFCGCIMEAYAWITHRPWTDHDETACPIIGAFLSSWNDNLPDDRRSILLPLLLALPNTKASANVERRRVIMISDWLIRVDTPAWLRLAGLTTQADALANLPEITDFETTPPLRAALQAAAHDAEALRAKEGAAGAVWDARDARAARAVWDARAARAARAARDARAVWAVWDARAARAARAVWDARDARAVWDARDAGAAGAARDAELKATVDHLDASAVSLIERLCALKN